IKARDLTCIARRLPLHVVEVGRDRNDGFSNFPSEKFFGGHLETLQDNGGNFGRAENTIEDFDVGVTVGRIDNVERNRLAHLLNFWRVVFASDKPLDRVESTAWICYALSLGDLAD